MSNATSVPASNGDFKLDADVNNKSVIPVVLSVSFLLMSLYGDNPDSPMYRAIGATATVMSISWYTD
ncbi:hypothetical protein [Oceaniserpentilla sp. 4NH20-0058]|uniref:hypothetical protein n=1 Tax=Oceaniserpentilla sp. 4NH20-0058 TaxID=3127660 RepID=UPI00333E28BA